MGKEGTPRGARSPALAIRSSCQIVTLNPATPPSAA
jgi:hypothetical protein